MKKQLASLGDIVVSFIFGAKLFLAVTWLFALGVVASSALERDVEGAKAAALGHSSDIEQSAPLRKLPDLTRGEPLPLPRKGKPATWQMGPTGLIGIKNGGNHGDQVQVISVVPGSPVEGKVLPGDVLLGVQGKDFVMGDDMNRIAGNAIIEAETEAGKGDLTIHIWRDRNWSKRVAAKDVFGFDLDQAFSDAESANDIYEWQEEEEKTAAVKQMSYDEFPIDGFYTNIALKLETMGTYSESSPWDCPVVEKMRANAWKVIAARFRKKDGRGRRGGGWPGVLALVASGRPEYVALAKQWVHQQNLCQDMEARVTLADLGYRGYQTWHHGFGALEMAIYYDATGDDFVLAELRKRAILVALGQNGGGSWGHTFAFREFNGGLLHKCNPGYGAMNNAGTRCFFLLTLAKKAGIEHPEINAAIWRASRFFGTFVDKGCIPYGYHSPYPSDDSNGKNYGATYAFYVLGRKYEAKFFAMHSANASFTRRGGHGSPTLWYYTPLSQNVAGPSAIKASMRNMRYLYALSRRHDGSFVFLGEQSPGIGGKGMRDPTATVAMHLSYPLKQLIITGKDADEDFWMTDKEYEELLISAAGMVDPKLVAERGKPWNQRSTDEVIEFLDHYYPKYRANIARELGRRYVAGEKDILQKIVARLGIDNARMRDGACKTLSACGTDAVLEHLSLVVAMLKDDAEFVRMQAAKTIGGATEPGDGQREVELLRATVDDYPGMTMDNGNVRSAVKGLLLSRPRGGTEDGGLGKLAISPFQAGYDEELVRLAMEKIVTMDPQGTVPGGWDREALLKLAGPIVFAASERQVNDAMFGGARKSRGQALLWKFGYREAVEGDAFNLIQRSMLDRGRRRGVRYKDGFITPGRVTKAPGRYRGLLDDLRLWQLDNPTLVLSEKKGKGRPPIKTPINLLIAIIQADTENDVLPSIGPDVAKMFESKLAAAGDAEAQFALCRKELEDQDRKNYFRKMCAMTHLAAMLGLEAIDDVSPYLGHEHWRLREHAERIMQDLVKQGGGPRLLELFQIAQAGDSGLLGNWNAAGILHVLATEAAMEHAASAVRPWVPKALAAAKGALKHDDPVVRGAAVEAVFVIGGDSELDTVCSFMLHSAELREDYNGAELALLSKKDDPAHVRLVSEFAIAQLPHSQPSLRRSLAWVLGQFGGEENLAAIQQAAETTEDAADLKELVLALAYSPDRAASENMVALVKVGKRIRDVVGPMSIHRMVGRNGIGDVTDAERVRFARGILNMTYDERLVTFLGKVHTGQAMQLLFDVMKMNPGTAAQSIIRSAEGMNNPSKMDAQLATSVLTEVIEYIEVTHLRGGYDKHVKHFNDAAGYARWKDFQARAGQALLEFNKPEDVAIPVFDDIDLDI